MLKFSSFIDKSYVSFKISLVAISSANEYGILEFVRKTLTGNLFAKTKTDLQSEYISVGLNPSGASTNLSIEAIPHKSAPYSKAIPLILVEVIIFIFFK